MLFVFNLYTNQRQLIHFIESLNTQTYPKNLQGKSLRYVLLSLRKLQYSEALSCLIQRFGSKFQAQTFRCRLWLWTN